MVTIGSFDSRDAWLNPLLSHAACMSDLDPRHDVQSCRRSLSVGGTVLVALDPGIQSRGGERGRASSVRVAGGEGWGSVEYLPAEENCG